MSERAKHVRDRPNRKTPIAGGHDGGLSPGAGHLVPTRGWGGGVDGGCRLTISDLAKAQQPRLDGPREVIPRTRGALARLRIRERPTTFGVDVGSRQKQGTNLMAQTQSQKQGSQQGSGVNNPSQQGDESDQRRQQRGSPLPKEQHQDPNEHIKKLIAARDKEVADRRDVAGKLAEKHQRGHAEDMREAVILIQKAIEAIDRAIADERRIANEEPVP
jgi:flagellar hook-basal body complex protein FliE